MTQDKKQHTKYWFTSDEHYFHKKIIEYSYRPFKDLDEMHKTLIDNHNEYVSDNDITIHVGDFSFAKWGRTQEIIEQLNGRHVFIKGSHDYWLKGQREIHEIWEKNCWCPLNEERFHVTACHYPMFKWPRSHYNSWHVFGHVHGNLKHHGKSHDVGVDNNRFYPVGLSTLKLIMSYKEDNPDLIKRK